MRNMSFTLTTSQMYAKTKTVTRRIGWSFLKAGDLVCAIEKGQGLKLGETVTRIGVIKIISVTAETLADITLDEVRREGFLDMNVPQFVRMFCKSHNCDPITLINRIEFEHVDSKDPLCQ